MGSWTGIPGYIRWVIVALVVCVSAARAQAACSAHQVQLRGAFGQARFTVEIANTPELRALGLMHREHMATSAGMLFLYERPQPLSFWMRNTLIELDMLFIDAKGVVRHIHNRAQPLDETPISGGPNLLSVLEINGGLAKAMGLKEGVEIQHPAFGPDAAWPCPTAGAGN